MIQLFKTNLKSYKWILLIGFAVQIITSFTSIGYHNPDEHWQINEFAAFKLGLCDDTVMPWEHHRQARPITQPFIVYSVSKVMMALDCFDPFRVAFLLRFFSGILAWVATMLLIFQSRVLFKSENIYKWCLLAANFLWFIPYVHTRFQSENWAGIFMAFGVFCVLFIFENKGKRWHFIFAGLLLGMAFNCRYQIGFSLAALGVWILFFKKASFGQILWMAIGFGIMIGVEVLLDYWYFATWIFMPYQYFMIQLVEGVSNGWGVFPWWYYFTLFAEYAAIPLSIVLLAMLMGATFFNVNNLFTWIIWSFVLGHNINGYKEIRYLYPLIPYFCILIFLVFNNQKVLGLLGNIKPSVIKFCLIILLIENFGFLIVASLKPANEAIGLLSKIYHYSDKPIKLYCIGKNPYDWGGIEYNFYKPKNITIIPFDSANFPTDLPTKNNNILVFNEGFDLDKKYANYNLAAIYKTVPEWLKYFNIGNWLSRTRVWGLYKHKVKDEEK